MDFEGLKRLAARKRDQAHETADADYAKAISVIESLQGIAPHAEAAKAAKAAKPKRTYQKHNWDNIPPAIESMPQEFKAADVVSAMGIKLTDAAYQAVNTRLNGMIRDGKLEVAQKRHGNQPHVYRRIVPSNNGSALAERSPDPEYANV